MHFEICLKYKSPVSRLCKYDIDDYCKKFGVIDFPCILVISNDVCGEFVNTFGWQRYLNLPLLVNSNPDVIICEITVICAEKEMTWGNTVLISTNVHACPFVLWKLLIHAQTLTALLSNYYQSSGIDVWIHHYFSVSWFLVNYVSK